ncbi:acyltransferase family protein [uncultured Legionella sp.]|uniref:acyltransferase family protein n=1 Tax=uncultured Legionella sp. TaxID=210934 RepID=UPI0026038F35|nr:acyltransferase family protein [uncultured Legionella sp.]
MKKNPGYRADIDGLRALAVSLVVLFHAFPNWVKGGFIGVDIFFVISGFLISTIVFTGLEHNHFSFLEFYKRRILRIFPALILVLSGCIVFGWFVLYADEYKQLGKHISSGAIFSSNFILLSESGYFDNLAETKPLLHLWSLGIEEQFYFVWPFILWFSWKKRFNYLTITITLLLISFLFNLYTIRSNSIAAFYLPQTRFWELLAGASLAYLNIYKTELFNDLKIKLDKFLVSIIYVSSPENNGATLRNIQSILGIVFIVVGLFFITKERAFPGYWAIFPIMGALLIISAGANAWVNQTFLSNKFIVWVGLISFPLYLWHWPLLAFARILENGTPSRGTRIAAILLAVLLSWLTYRFIEKPIRFGKNRNAKAFVPILLMVLLAGAGLNIFGHDGLQSRDHIKALQNVNDAFVGPLWNYTKNDTCLNKYPLAGSEDYGWWFCMASTEEKPTLLLLGTSYANELYPGLLKNNSINHHNILSIGTCDAANIDETKFVQSKPGLEYGPCVGYRHAEQQKLINNIINSGSLKFVIIDGINPNPDKEYILHLKERIDLIEASGARVIVFYPHIPVDFDIRGCYARPFGKSKENCDLDPVRIKEIVKKYDPLISFIQSSNPDVAFFDRSRLFCKNDKCSFIDDGKPLLRDAYGHISEYGSIQLSKLFENWAQHNVPELLA